MNKKIFSIVTFLLLAGLTVGCLWGQTNLDFTKVHLTLSIPKDTLVVGEPIITTFTLTNNGEKPVEIIFASCLGLIEECLQIYLVTSTGHKSRFVYGVHRSYPKGSTFPTFRLNPGDTISEIGTLWWFNFLPFMPKEIHGKIENLPPGEYRLTAVYHPKWFVPDPWRNMRLASNEVSFQVISATGEDLDVLQKMENNRAIREYFLSSAIQPEVIKAFGDLKDKNSIFTQYCHFFYAGFLSPRSARIAELYNFIKRYPDSPSVELVYHELVYDLRAESRIEEANKVVEELKFKYSNSMVIRIFLNKLAITPGRHNEAK